jgi:hypothetical protein
MEIHDGADGRPRLADASLTASELLSSGVLELTWVSA